MEGRKRRLEGRERSLEAVMEDWEAGRGVCEIEDSEAGRGREVGRQGVMVETTGAKIGRQVIRVGRQKGGYGGKEGGFKVFRQCWKARRRRGRQ